METSSGASFHQQQAPLIVPPLNQHTPPRLQASLSLLPDDAVSPTESESSRETWPIEKNNNQEQKDHSPDQKVVRRITAVEKLSLRDVAGEPVAAIAERMTIMPEELVDELRSELRAIIEGAAGASNRDQLLGLQRILQGRSDLTETAMLKCHRAQLEMLVAIKTGIQAFLHPNISLSQGRLIEIFAQRRCRNIGCQSSLPADDCGCDVCSSRKGFCNLCMCVVCNKFDFEVNTCRWIGCDLCLHWTHTDCAIRTGLITMAASPKRGPAAPPEMMFRCQACNRSSELLGWVKDVFQQCSPGWNRDAMARELDLVSRIFSSSEDHWGRKLLWKCGDVLDKLKSGVAEAAACRMMMIFFQEMDMEAGKATEAAEAGRAITPHEACGRITDVVQEAVRKMEAVAEEKTRMLKRCRQAVEACDRELEEKAREVAELKLERQRRRQQVDELESIVRLKQAEAEMFQFKAAEARREAERLQSIAMAKSQKAEQEYASRYLKARLEEAEMEKQYLFEKIKLQESHRPGQPGAGAGAGAGSVTAGGSRGSEPSQMMMMCKIQDLLKNVYGTVPKSEAQNSGDHPH